MQPISFNLADLGLGQWIVIGLSVLVGVWFVAGIAVNRRVGRRARAWLASGLDGYTCGQPSWVDLATAAVVTKAARPALPLERIEAILALERRENLPLWLFQHAAGKRDSVILRANLKKKPVFEAHLIPSSEYAQIAAYSHREPPLQRGEDRDGFTLFVGGDASAPAIQALEALKERFKGSLIRVSVRGESPHLLLHVRLVALRDASPAVALALDEIARKSQA